MINEKDKKLKCYFYCRVKFNDLNHNILYHIDKTSNAFTSGNPLLGLVRFVTLCTQNRLLMTVLK